MQFGFQGRFDLQVWFGSRGSPVHAVQFARFGQWWPKSSRNRNCHENSHRESCECADRCILHRISIRINLFIRPAFGRAGRLRKVRALRAGPAMAGHGRLRVGRVRPAFGPVDFTANPCLITRLAAYAPFREEDVRVANRGRNALRPSPPRVARVARPKCQEERSCILL